MCRWENYQINFNARTCYEWPVTFLVSLLYLCYWIRYREKLASKPLLPPSSHQLHCIANHALPRKVIEIIKFERIKYIKTQNEKSIYSLSAASSLAKLMFLSCNLEHSKFDSLSSYVKIDRTSKNSKWKEDPSEALSNTIFFLFC